MHKLRILVNTYYQWFSWHDMKLKLRLCSHFADRFCSKMLLLCNDLSTQPVECSGMSCPDVIGTEQLKQSRKGNMASTTWKTNINKGTLMQIWKSANIFVFIWKWYVEDFTLKHLLLFETCAHEICEKFVYKHSETIENVKNQPTFWDIYKCHG